MMSNNPCLLYEFVLLARSRSYIFNHCSVGLVLGFSLLLGYTLRAALNTKGHSVGNGLFVGSLSPLVVLKTKDCCQSGHTWVM